MKANPSESANCFWELQHSWLRVRRYIAPTFIQHNVMNPKGLGRSGMQGSRKRNVKPEFTGDILLASVMRGELAGRVSHGLP
jgi:hypothetical protein